VRAYFHVDFLHAAIWWQWAQPQDTAAASAAVKSAVTMGQCYLGQDTPLRSTWATSPPKKRQPSAFLQFLWEPALIEWFVCKKRRFLCCLAYH